MCIFPNSILSKIEFFRSILNYIAIAVSHHSYCITKLTKQYSFIPVISKQGANPRFCPLMSQRGQDEGYLPKM